MNIPIVSAKVKLMLFAVAGLALVAGGAGLAWWGFAPRLALSEERQATAQKQLDEQTGVLTRLESEIQRVGALDKRLNLMQQTISRNEVRQDRAIEDLKRNDKLVADYLDMPVPDALGRLYERPETTDPEAYDSPTAVLAGPLPSTGKAATETK